MKNEWISVKERLPEIDDEVIIYVDGITDCAFYIGRNIFERGNRIRETDVTHWMPIPEPPQEEPEVKVGM